MISFEVRPREQEQAYKSAQYQLPVVERNLALEHAKLSLYKRSVNGL